MNKKKAFQKQDAEFSGAEWTQEDGYAAHAGMGDEPASGRRSSAGAMLALMILLAVVTALAVGISHSGRYDEMQLAEQALEEKYGVTGEMAAFFSRSARKDMETTVVTYDALEGFDYVLGDYWVVIEGKAADAAWSWDGTPVAEGFDAAPWGAAQMEEMLAHTRETNDFSQYYHQATALAETAEQAAQKRPAAASFDSEAWEKAQQEGAARMRFAMEELVASGREAVTAAYGFPQDSLAYLLHEPTLDYYLPTEDGKAWLQVVFSFGMAEEGTDVSDTHPQWEHLKGLYGATIDVETGEVEEVSCDSGLAGKG